MARVWIVNWVDLIWPALVYQSLSFVTSKIVKVVLLEDFCKDEMTSDIERFIMLL